VNTIADAAVPAIQKATLLEHLSNFPSRVGIEAQMSYLSHNSPLVRSAAARSMRLAPAEIRWQSLKHLAEDPVKTVRYAVAEAISDIQSEIPLKDIGVFYDLIGEYRESLSLSNDMPSTQTEIANLELGLGNADKAESAYLAALLIEPHFVPALLNLADLYRATNRESKAKTYLDRALAFAPDSGAVNYSYGLSLVRQTKYEEALPFLKAATQQMDSEPRYAYAYAVALDSINRTKQALVFLEQANAHWPNQYNLLMTQVLYMEKLGQTENMPGLLSKLSRLAPNAPEVKQRVRRYIERQNPGQREN